MEVQTVDPTWHSPLLNVNFELLKDTLKIYDSEGKPFLTYVERAGLAKKAEKKAQKAEEKAQKAEEKVQKVEEEKQKAIEEESKTISEKDAEIAQLKALLEKSGLKNI